MQIFGILHINMDVNRKQSKRRADSLSCLSYLLSQKLTCSPTDADRPLDAFCINFRGQFSSRQKYTTQDRSSYTRIQKAALDECSIYVLQITMTTGWLQMLLMVLLGTHVVEITSIIETGKLNAYKYFQILKYLHEYVHLTIKKCRNKYINTVISIIE